MSDMITPHRFRSAHEKGIVHFLATGHGPVIGKRLEMAALHRDGHELPIELLIASTSQFGEPVFLGCLRDISERRDAVRRQELLIGELNQSEERLRVATEAAHIGVWEIGLPARTLTSTPTLKAVYGLPADIQPTYDEIRALTHPDDLPRVLEGFDRAISGENEYNIVYRVQRPDGQTAWVEVRGHVVRSADGTPFRILGASRDVTERQLAEERLQLSEESLRLATDAAEVGTWDLDLRTEALTWSNRTKAMFGISPDVPCSMSDSYTGLHPDDLDQTSGAFASAIDPARRTI